ncbi:hypothetical protein BGZ91_003329, partial [Linnemannia elongata]
ALAQPLTQLLTQLSQLLSQFLLSNVTHLMDSGQCAAIIRGLRNPVTSNHGIPIPGMPNLGVPAATLPIAASPKDRLTATLMSSNHAATSLI